MHKDETNSLTDREADLIHSFKIRLLENQPIVLIDWEKVYQEVQ